MCVQRSLFSSLSLGILLVPPSNSQLAISCGLKSRKERDFYQSSSTATDELKCHFLLLLLLLGKDTVAAAAVAPILEIMEQGYVSSYYTSNAHTSPSYSTLVGQNYGGRGRRERGEERGERRERQRRER